MKNFTISCLLILTGVTTYSQNPHIAFIGQATSYDSLIVDQDGFSYNDDQVAAMWFIDTFLPAHAATVDGSYFSFEEVANGASLVDFDVIWIQMDGATYVDRMNEWPRGTTEGNGDKHCVIRNVGFQWNGQCSSTEDAFMSNIRSYYEAGGKILLGNYAGKALEVIGAFDGLSNPWEYRPNQTFGDTSANEGNTAGSWGTSWASGIDSPFISSIAISASDCPNSQGYIEFLTSDTQKKNRACQYNLDFGRIFDDAGGAGSSISDRRSLFTSTLNAEILLQNCDGNEIQGARFNPLNQGDGTIVWYGAGVYDWYAPGTGNNNNVKLLTENTLLYLAENNLSVNEIVSNNVSYYPNPVNNELHILNAGHSKKEIFDLTGKKLLDSQLETIDFSKFGSGFYLVKVSDPATGNQHLFKIVKR